MAYLPLSTANLPEPTISPANDAEPRDYFETFLYTGNGAGLQVGDVIKKPADTTDITNSLIFDGSTSYLSHTTSGTSSGQDQITVSFWIKNWKPDTSTFNHIWSALEGGSDLCFYMALTTTHTIRFYFDETPSGSVGPTYFDTPMAFTDTSRWYHVHLKVDLNQSTTAEKYQVWVDGVQQTFSYTVQGGVQETNVDLFQNGTTHNIGRYIGNSSQHLGMYLAELHAVDGTAHDPTDFGNFDANGIWIPKTVTGITYGTNGFYLDFNDNTSTTTLGEDQEGSNDWTLNNFATTDQVSDSPTNNFMTMSSANADGTPTLSEGNLRVSVSDNDEALGSFKIRAKDAGKFYWEVDYVSSAASNYKVAIGIANEAGTAEVINYGHQAPTYNTTNLIGVALDTDNQTIEWFKDGVSMGTATDYSNKNWTYVRPTITSANSSGEEVVEVNFGQKTFAETPPTGYVALSENNITVDDQNLESPDFVWIKSRGAARHHGMWDSVRGAGKLLQSSSADAETDRPYGVLEFNTNGFTLGPEDPSWHYNEPGIDEVAWCWKAGTPFNYSGETGTIDSVGSVNTESGFSIVTYTGSSVANEERVKHGLSSAPEMILVKNRSGGDNWAVYHKDLTTNYFLELNSTGAQQSGSNPRFLSGDYGTSTPTSTYFYVRNYSGSTTNDNGDDYVAYCFHSVEGFSKFGSYTGSSSLPFVYLGFRPSWIMVKQSSTSGENWEIWDKERGTYNIDTPLVYANLPNNETSGTAARFDIVSNGFKIRSTNAGVNASGATYIYMAFAENPFKYSNAR